MHSLDIFLWIWEIIAICKRSSMICMFFSNDVLEKLTHQAFLTLIIVNLFEECCKYSSIMLPVPQQAEPIVLAQAGQSL
jgi:RsiW-degrading membrane proteinase PrsW (M82 family)